MRPPNSGVTVRHLILVDKLKERRVRRRPDLRETGDHHCRQAAGVRSRIREWYAVLRIHVFIGLHGLPETGVAHIADSKFIQIGGAEDVSPSQSELSLIGREEILRITSVGRHPQDGRGEGMLIRINKMTEYRVLTAQSRCGRRMYPH